MAVKNHTRSFAGGEISPEITGRIDLVKFQTGCLLARNFTALPHGPLARRPGFEFVNRCRGPVTRVIPFNFGIGQTVVLEFSIPKTGFLGGKIRFHTNGGTVLEAAKAATTNGTSTVTTTLAHGFTTGDWIFEDLTQRYYIITVTGANTFTITDLDGVVLTLPTSSTNVARVYEVNHPYAAVNLFELNYAQSADVMTLTHPNYPAATLSRLSAASWVYATISFAPTLASPSGIGATPTVAVVGNPVNHTYVVTAVAADLVTESIASATASCNNDLTLAGNFNTIAWTGVLGAGRYYVYKRRGGSFGYIGQTNGTSLVDNNILADTTQSPPEDIITLNTGAGAYPSAVTYHEQRKWFAGTTLKPQVLFATRTGTESNLTSSLPSRDADGLELRVASSQNNTIRHLVALQDLVAFTAGSEFRIYSDNAPAITPSTVSIKPQGYSGAGFAQPIVTSRSVLFTQVQNNRIREMSYTFEANSYQTNDVTLFVNHRFDFTFVQQMAFVRSPVPTLWCVLDNGLLAGMTYVPEQQVYAWHFHDSHCIFQQDTNLQSNFKSCCVVTEGVTDTLYVVVARRTSNGAGEVPYLERLRPRAFDSLDNAFFVDSGLSYSGAPTQTITGLHHLNGNTVDILADGKVQPRQVVANGVVLLEEAASTVHVGLPYTSDFSSLPLVLEGAQAQAQGTTKNVNRVHLRVTSTSHVKAGPSFDALTQQTSRTVQTPMNAPPGLINGELSFNVPPTWSQEGTVNVRQDLPLPLTLLSMTVEVATGG